MTSLEKGGFRQLTIEQGGVMTGGVCPTPRKSNRASDSNGLQSTQSMQR